MNENPVLPLVTHDATHEIMAETQKKSDNGSYLISSNNSMAGLG